MTDTAPNQLNMHIDINIIRQGRYTVGFYKGRFRCAWDLRTDFHYLKVGKRLSLLPVCRLNVPLSQGTIAVVLQVALIVKVEIVHLLPSSKTHSRARAAINLADRRNPRAKASDYY